MYPETSWNAETNATAGPKIVHTKRFHNFSDQLPRAHKDTRRTAVEVPREITKQRSPGTIIFMMSHCRTCAPPVLAMSLVFPPLPFFSTAT